MKFDVTPERQRADPPARAARIDPREQLRTEAKGERVDFDAAPPSDEIVAQFVNEDDEAENQDERDNVPPEPGHQVGDRIHYRHPRPPAPPEATAATGR